MKNKLACHCRKGSRVCFWCITQTAAFPLEHFVWERAWGFSYVTKALGL